MNIVAYEHLKQRAKDFLPRIVSQFAFRRQIIVCMLLRISVFIDTLLMLNHYMSAELEKKKVFP
jgi:hypothetical protein